MYNAHPTIWPRWRQIGTTNIVIQSDQSKQNKNQQMAHQHTNEQKHLLHGIEF